MSDHRAAQRHSTSSATGLGRYGDTYAALHAGRTVTLTTALTVAGVLTDPVVLAAVLLLYLIALGAAASGEWP